MTRKKPPALIEERNMSRFSHVEFMRLFYVEINKPTKKDGTRTRYQAVVEKLLTAAEEGEKWAVIKTLEYAQGTPKQTITADAHLRPRLNVVIDLGGSDTTKVIEGEVIK